ncbi:hypothetical protein R8Z50_30355 [Longispora sp. K20-0274]|uniref:hypothetical protein n=1 Tax=Longispora sp. K20-0274 TaxID=3088255 RepID=UPI00399992C5
MYQASGLPGITSRRSQEGIDTRKDAYDAFVAAAWATVVRTRTALNVDLLAPASILNRVPAMTQRYLDRLVEGHEGLLAAFVRLQLVGSSQVVQAAGDLAEAVGMLCEPGLSAQTFEDRMNAVAAAHREFRMEARWDLEIDRPSWWARAWSWARYRSTGRRDEWRRKRVGLPGERKELA